MSRKIRFLGVGHEIIVEEDPPYFLGDHLHARVKVRNLKPKPVKKRFCYILQHSGGMGHRTMEFDLGPNEEQVHPLYDNKPPYYLGFIGNFRIALLIGEPGRRFNKGGEPRIPYHHPHEPLFVGIVWEKSTYVFHARSIETVKIMAQSAKTMSQKIEAIRESNKRIRESNKRTGELADTIASVGNNTLYLTIVIAVLAVVEILTLVLG